MTNADSLDYHLGVPLYILNFLEFPNFKSWIHYSLSGSGELLNTIGLSFHSEQILSMTQFGGILSIVGILKNLIKIIIFSIIFYLHRFNFLKSSKASAFILGSNCLCFAIVFKPIFLNISNSDIFKICITNYFIIFSYKCKIYFCIKFINYLFIFCSNFN